MNTKRNRKKEGFLQVKLSSRSALGKAWKRKWVVVQQNTSSAGKSLLLELYIEKGAYHKTVISLLLEDVVSVRRTKSKTQEHAIEISTAAKTLLAVSGDSETETQEWLQMFKMNLLPPIAELQCPPGIPQGFVRVAIVPNKYSDALNLEGDYFAHVSLANINLYNTHTGKLAQEWDLRHLKKFMLISKCHPLDVEKIVHILPSKRSPKGEGEFVFFSSRGKELVEDIYGRLSNAMTVKSRRSRSASMLFEITPQELEQIMKDSQQPPEETPEETLQEVDEERNGGEEVNGETRMESAVDQEAQANEVDAGDGALVPDVEPEGKTGEDTGGDGKELATKEPDRPPKEEDVKNRDVADEEEKRNDDTQEAESSSDANIEDVARQLGEVNGSSQTQDANGNLIDEQAQSNEAEQKINVVQEISGEEKISDACVAIPEQNVNVEEEVNSESKGQDDDKANQTNPDEMDACLEAADEPHAGLDSVSSSEQTTTPRVVAVSGQGSQCAGDSSGVGIDEQGEPDHCQGNTPNLLTEETNQDVENRSENKHEVAVAEDGNQNQEREMGGETDKQAANADEVTDKVDNDDVNSKVEVQTDQTSALLQNKNEENDDRDAKDDITLGEAEKDILSQEAGPERQASNDAGEQHEVNKETKDVSLETSVHSYDVDHTESKANINVEDPAASAVNSKTTDVDPVAKSDHGGNPENAALENTEPSGAQSPNHNNSNANEPMTVPLPNALTSRMAEALKNAQKRKLSANSPASQETQTEFSPDGADQTEIIV